MRCLTLANALVEQGTQTVFVCRAHEGHLKDTILAQGHECFLLPATNNVISKQPDMNNIPPHAAWLGESWQTDADQTKQVLTERHFDWLVVDHYALDARWETAMRSVTKNMMVIDDLADRQHNCDVLLDQTLARKESAYQPLVPEHCTLLCGSAYAMLRPEFSHWRAYSLQRRQQPVLKNILINLGGVDQDNITGKVLTQLAQCTLPVDINIIVVLGITAPYFTTVSAQAKQMPFKTEVKTQVTNMAEMMANSDLAIGAAGTTAWERCCLGLPALMFVLAPNQLQVAEALRANGAAVVLVEPSDIVNAISRYQQPALLKTMAIAASEVTCGNGIATVIAAMRGKHD
jgi:UDP-2,4-diacetamido-2,4,6-trideoxy-beta-L-altropyranose hydrolase